MSKTYVGSRVRQLRNERGFSQAALAQMLEISLNRPGMSGDSSSWKGWGHVRWFIEEVPAGAA
nr:helix-turn-helix transcriptional regulator [Mycobacterium tuberculosis]